MPEATMRAVVKAAPGPGLALHQVPVPEVGPTDVLIRVEAASICGTDVHIYNWDGWSAERIKPPLVLGHEFAGRVAALGAGVTDLPLDTPVSAEGHILMSDAKHVVPGQEHLARDQRVIGIDRAGAFAEYIAVPRRNVWVNPPDLDPRVASLQDPFGNAVHTVYAQEVAGRVVLLTGAGLIGLMAVPLVKLEGAVAVIVTDVNRARLEMALGMGADHVIDAGTEDVVARVDKLTGGRGADVLLEMSGHSKAISDGLRALRPGGEVALLGLPAGTVELDWGNLVVLKGVIVRGIYGRRIWETWHRMRGLLASRAIDLTALITHEFPLNEYEAAFDVMRNGSSGKVILRP